MAEKEIYRVVVPEDQRTYHAGLYDQTPLEYRITASMGASMHSPTSSRVHYACMIHGRYPFIGWKPNASARWLVRHLIEENERLKAVIKHCFSYDPEVCKEGLFPIGLSLTFADGLDAETVKKVLLEKNAES